MSGAVEWEGEVGGGVVLVCSVDIVDMCQKRI